jgi:hypothetical protein
MPKSSRKSRKRRLSRSPSEWLERNSPTQGLRPQDLCMDSINSKVQRDPPIRKRMTRKYSEIINIVQTRAGQHSISTLVVLNNNLNNRRKKSRLDKKNPVVELKLKKQSLRIMLRICLIY